MEYKFTNEHIMDINEIEKKFSGKFTRTEDEEGNGYAMEIKPLKFVTDEREYNISTFLISDMLPGELLVGDMILKTAFRVLQLNEFAFAFEDNEFNHIVMQILEELDENTEGSC